MTTEQKETIRKSLRFCFDFPKTTDCESIDIMKAMESIDHEAYLEMKSDLISEGIINE